MNCKDGGALIPTTAATFPPLSSPRRRLGLEFYNRTYTCSSHNMVEEGRARKLAG